MAPTPKKKQHAVPIIRPRAFAQLREEHFFPEAQTLERLLDSMTELLRDGLETQEKEREKEEAETKAGKSFLVLPAEIRNLIYEFALVSSRPLCIRTGKAIDEDFKTSRTPTTPTIALLQTSRQVREEALPIYLGQNTFRIELKCENAKAMLKHFKLGELKQWQDVMGERQFDMVRNLDVVVRLGYQMGAPRIRGPRFSHRPYTEAICARTGATLRQLRAFSPVKDWDVNVVKQAMAFDKLGLEGVNIQLTMKAG